MKVRIHYNHRFPGWIGRRAIVLYPYIFVALSEKEARKCHLLHHEWIHITQIRNTGYIKFYCKYVGEWIANMCKYRNYENAYRNISYEKEAYEKQNDINLPNVLV